MVTEPRRRVTPVEVVEAGLGYEYLRAKWVAEDDRGSKRRRRIGRAMMVEIRRIAEQRKERKA